MNQLYSIKNLSFSYKFGKMQVNALAKVSLEISQNSLVCLSGPSGSGKSTLLNILGLIEPIQEGSVFFNGLSFTDLSESEKNRIRRFEIGFVFQKFHLLPVLTVEENVEYFLARQGIKPILRKELIGDALNAVGLYEMRGKKPFEMSGGQQQRVAIARALVKRPKVIIADEPTASLDQKTAKEVMELLQTLVDKKQMSVVLASHDPMVHAYSNQHVEVVNGGLKCI